MTPRALLDAAETLLEDAGDHLPGAWPRAVALLARQALELLVEGRVPPSLRSAPFSVRLFWLRQDGDKEEAERLAATWSALSEACHFHGYELPPTAASLRGWIAVVDAAVSGSRGEVSARRMPVRPGAGEIVSGGGVDDVQEDLVAWLDRGDMARGNRALRAISDEWRGRIRRFLRSPLAEEVDEVLGEAMLELCTAEAPRVRAPDDVVSASAWRATVLRNWLVSRMRKHLRRLHAERAYVVGLTPAAERAVWRVRGELPPVVASSGEDDAHDPLERLLAERRRAEVVRRARDLAPRRAVLVLLVLRADVEPLVPALARTLNDTVERVAHRVRRALASEPDGVHPYLTRAMVRVVYPDQPEAQALEAARKALARAVSELRAQCSESA